MPTPLDHLREQCLRASRLWRLLYAGLTIVAHRELGEVTLERLFRGAVGDHQATYYRAGLEKLGIAGDPAAVAAAKYHYLSNRIGGLPMEYVEESPRKVWIRYGAPNWAYEGLSLLALPASLGRITYSIWHPRNGELMGCRRLGWVATRFQSEGETCDEGYFIEHDHDLAPGEAMKFEAAVASPRFDPARAPVLDPALWPEERLLKARRNFVADYVQSFFGSLARERGEDVACRILAQTARGLAIQYTHDLCTPMNLDGPGIRRVVDFHARILGACGQDYDVELIAHDRCRIQVRSWKPFNAANEGLRAALFEFHAVAGRLIDGHVQAKRQPGVDAETWEFWATGDWHG